MRKGYVQVYTGNGKGKTTAAIGLAVRAAGAGNKVLIVQFMKKQKCSEHKALKRFQGLITIRQYGTGLIMGRDPSAADIAAARRGLDAARKNLVSGDYDVVILDEANLTTYFGMLAVTDLLKLIAVKPRRVELVMTGRHADKKIMKAADLVTEMREIKHYQKQGVNARRGIEK